ncbi:uncharacterized protein TNCV_4232511 [Trichonephila clavipes]|nr:uncharacterized protein TNCV_4232511 [Trichonephila clavipes]
MCERIISGRNLRAASFGQEIHDFISRDVSIFCYGSELIDNSNAHEVIHTSPVLQVLDGASAICNDPMLLESVLLRMDFTPSSIAINSLRTGQFSGLRLESRIEGFSMKAPLPVRFDSSLLPSVYINMASLGIPL